MNEPIHAASDEELARELLRRIVGDNENMAREGLLKTPARMVKALRELTSGYEGGAPHQMQSILTTFDGEGDGIVVVRDLPFASLCEHHVLPFTGMVSVAYLPSERIVGLSKIPRVVRKVTRRLQVQERIGNMIADTLEEGLKPQGIAVVVRAQHTCMCLRGIESHGEMVTSHVRGVFKTDQAARAEVLRLFESGR